MTIGLREIQMKHISFFGAAALALIFSSPAFAQQQPASPTEAATPKALPAGAEFKRGWLAKLYLTPVDRTTRPVDPLFVAAHAQNAVSVNGINSDESQGPRAFTIDGYLVVREAGRHAPFIEVNVPATTTGQHFENCVVELQIETAGTMETLLSANPKHLQVNSRQGRVETLPARPVILEPGIYRTNIYAACGEADSFLRAHRATKISLRIKGPSDAAARPAEIIYRVDKEKKESRPASAASGSGLEVADDAKRK